MTLAFSPRVVGRERPDFHCLESILASPQFAGRSGEELVLAIYDYFTSRVDGTYHFWPAGETEGNPRVRRSVSDPIKLLNAYGWAICGQCAQMLQGLYTAAGLEARLVGLPGHVVCEVRYDGAWHVLDVDMWTWFRTPAGHIASAAELAERPEELILRNPNRSDPCDLPDRSLDDYAKMYAKAKTVGDRVEGVSPPWAIRAHSMDFRLRPGETLIRSQDNEGRFHMPQDWLQSKEKYKREWKGYPRERYEPFRTFGNGRWIYRPDLTAGSGDFRAGLWEASDLSQDASGLVGPGGATWRIASPYPFCGVPDWGAAPGSAGGTADEPERVRYADGVWLELAGRGPARAELTDPEGKWAKVLAADGDFDERIDVTPLLSSRYECLIRLALGAGARLARFGFDGYLATAPMSIPRLVAGENPMELRWGDKYGLCTEVCSEVVDFREGADLPGRWRSAENVEIRPYVDGWSMIAPARDGPVSVVFRFEAPAGRGFAWAYVHAGVREGPADRPKGRAKLEWTDASEDRPENWREVAAIEISNTPKQWDCSLDGEVRFPAAPGAADRAEGHAVLVRVTSETPITGLEFHGHLACGQAQQGDLAASGGRLRVVHRWREGDRQRSFEAPPGALEYTITCGENPGGHTIEMHVPSVGPDPDNS